MKIRRAKSFHGPSPQDQRCEARSQFKEGATSMDLNAMASHFHPRGYPVEFDARTTFQRQASVASKRAPASENRFPEENFTSYAYIFETQTPPPRSWDLASPPKPRRVATCSTPFPVRQNPPHPSYSLQATIVPPPVPRNIIMPAMTVCHLNVGDPSLKIFRVRLPPHLLHLLDGIVMGCEAHAATLPNGWQTDLYSLTKQDIALRKIPHLYDAAKPITNYIKVSIATLMRVHSIKVDKNQPHVLKYSTDDEHTGVELHHDKCDVTANLCLSRSTSYVGGGTVFPAIRQVVRLEYGELLLHPGKLVHGGMNITSGSRHLMILFANVA